MLHDGRESVGACGGDLPGAHGGFLPPLRAVSPGEALHGAEDPCYVARMRLDVYVWHAVILRGRNVDGRHGVHSVLASECDALSALGVACSFACLACFTLSDSTLYVGVVAGGAHGVRHCNLLQLGD